MLKRFIGMIKRKEKIQQWDDVIDMEHVKQYGILDPKKGETQCLLDWRRDQDIIFIDHASLRDIHRRRGGTKLDKDKVVTSKYLADKGWDTEGGRFESRERKANPIVSSPITIESLKNIWQKDLLDKLWDNDKEQNEKQKKMFEYMFQFMHQAGYKNMLQHSLGEIASRSIPHFSIPTSGMDSKLEIFVDGNEIHLRETVKVHAITGFMEPEAYIAKGSKEKPLMTAVGEYILFWNKEKDKPDCKIDSVFLHHHNIKTQKLFDPKKQLTPKEEVRKMYTPHQP